MAATSATLALNFVPPRFHGFTFFCFTSADVGEQSLYPYRKLLIGFLLHYSIGRRKLQKLHGFLPMCRSGCSPPQRRTALPRSTHARNGGTARTMRCPITSQRRLLALEGQSVGTSAGPRTGREARAATEGLREGVGSYGRRHRGPRGQGKPKKRKEEVLGTPRFSLLRPISYGDVALRCV
jgi:hypothetical protein